MPEPTLSLRKEDYEVELADFLGLTRNPTRWSDDNKARMKRDIGSGLRRFYYCIPSHDWSFLRPFATLTLLEGETVVALPDDFGGVEGRIAVSDGSNGIFTPIDFDNPGRVQQLYSVQPTLTGRPQVASERPIKAMPANKGQKNEIFLFPIADRDYSLTFQYYMNPGYLLDVGMPYAYGGAEHSETILESCLAVAEERRDNIAEGQGPHGIAFNKRLMASIEQDRRKKPQKLGRNHDLSDDDFTRFNPRVLTSGFIRINGIVYD